MAGGRNKLAAKKVELHAKPGYLNDGGNLYLQIAKREPAKATEKTRTKKTDEVTKSWVFRYRHRVTERLIELGLGPFPDVSLEEARDKAAGMRALLRNKKDPKTEIAAKRAEEKAAEAKSITFDEAAAKCIAGKFPGWDNAKHAQQWTNTLKTYASPVLGSLPVDMIDLALIRKVLDPIWATKNETASRVRQRMEAVLSWATDSDGDVVRMDVFRVSVTPLYQLRQDEWVSSFSIGDKNSTYQRSPIELFEIEEKSGPQAEDQKLLVRTACERMEIMIREFEGRQSLEEKDRRKLEALLDARSTPIMMPDSTRKGSGLPIYVTYFVPVQFPMLTPWELSTQKRKAQSRGLN